MTRLAPESQELVALGPWDPGRFGADWPTKPGGVLRDAGGACEALHFAPGRWLLPAPSASLLARCGELAAAGVATLVDTEGKWLPLTVEGAVGARRLAAGAPLGLMLSGRDCAALTLFDCPVIVGRGRDSFDVWVPASYAAHLEKALGLPDLTPALR